MGKIFVTLIYGNSQTKDLALPGDIPSQFLAEAIARAVAMNPGNGQICYLEVISANEVRRISPARSLEEARVYTGSFIQIGIENQANGQDVCLISSSGVRFLLNKTIMVIGRPTKKSDSPVDVDLSPLDRDTVVSRSHAVIRFEGNQIKIVDAGRNGTWLNNFQLVPGQPYVLTHGDTISFGPVARGGVVLTFSNPKSGQRP